jgi:hypothetical protein
VELGSLAQGTWHKAQGTRHLAHKAWLAQPPARLAASLEEFTGHPAYGIPQLRDDLERFTSCLAAATGRFLGLSQQ